MGEIKRIKTAVLTTLLSLGLLPAAHALGPANPNVVVPSPVDNDRRCAIGMEDSFAGDIAKIPAPSNGFTRWEYGKDDNYNPCRDLSYVVLAEVTRNPLPPKQIMLYHRGVLLGTTLACYTEFQELAAATDNSVTVDYYYWKDKTPGDEQYATSVTYRWDGEKVVMEGQLPDDLFRVCPQ
ncbi:LppP/LprE family lipoprotein [Staphylococcus chromogenes]|nr:LppP/LprE family lipoprotein [Staphylococcus chromogenes]